MLIQTSFAKVAILLACLNLSIETLEAQRLYIVNSSSVSIDEGTGEIVVLAKTRAIPYDANEGGYATLTAFVSAQTGGGYGSSQQSDSNSGTLPIANVSMYNNVNLLGSTYYVFGTHRGTIQDGMAWETQTGGTYDEHFVPLPPSVSLQSINAWLPEDVGFNYSISAPVLFSLQLHWGSSITMSSDYHTTSTRLGIDQNSIPSSTSTSADLWGSMYGINMLFSSCSITNSRVSQYASQTDAVLIPPGSGSSSAFPTTIVQHHAWQEMDSFSYCMPVPAASETLRLVQTLAAVDTTSNPTGSARNMFSPAIVETAAYPLSGYSFTLDVPPSQIQTPTWQIRGNSWGNGWLLQGTTTTICNAGFALLLGNGAIVPYPSRGCLTF
jgi:hypothetical protein